MIEFTAWQYICIDVANHWGMDKLRFEDRIKWTEDNIHDLEIMGVNREWKEKPLYLSAVLALRKAQEGKPTGYLVELDSVNSGMQIMSVLTGCTDGARATGLVDPDRRADAYTDCTAIMEQLLGTGIHLDRNLIKQGVMLALYGSKKEPIKLFGEDTPELSAFYKALYKLAPGACQLLNALIASWNPNALVHSWKLPDGYDAVVKVMDKGETRITVDELGGARFTYAYKTNTPIEKAVKNGPNVIHSVDAYILRSVIRRCNYDKELFQWAYRAIEEELLDRVINGLDQRDSGYETDKLQYYIKQYERSTVVDVVIVPHLYAETVCELSTEHLRALNKIIGSMLDHEPFEIITVHDAFKCHANNANYMRKHYRDILAEIGESNLLSDLMSQLYGHPVPVNKINPNLPELIRQSAYAIC